MDRKELIIAHINERLRTLTELGKIYSPEKIDELATNLSSSPKSLTEICTLIDNKFSNQVRKIKHNNHVSSLKEYYLSSIDKLRKGNNCYLFSYDQGVKIIEQAYLKEVQKRSPYLTEILVNNNELGFKKENNPNNDYELIMSDLAYLLNIPYAKTYRIFDKNMEPTGILNISFTKKKEKFLSLEETLQFIKEESPKFNLKNELIDYHDRNVKNGLKHIPNEAEYQKNINYVLGLFKALPDITDKNYEQLKHDYLNMKVFELLTNSLNNNLNNIGLIINQEKIHYTYRLSPSYNKYTTSLSSLKKDETICNFHIVNKKVLLDKLVKHHYKDIKDLLSLIINNRNTLIPIIDQVLKEHLLYDDYVTYHQVITDNFNMMIEVATENQFEQHLTVEDRESNEENNQAYSNRITPFVDNYVADEYENEKGSIILTAVVALVLFVTIAIVLLAIYSISRMDM